MQGKSPIIFILYLYVYLHSVIKRGVGNRYYNLSQPGSMSLVLGLRAYAFNARSIRVPSYKGCISVTLYKIPYKEINTLMMLSYCEWVWVFMI